MSHSYIIHIDCTRDHQGAVLLNEEVDREVPDKMLLQEVRDAFQPAIIRISFLPSEDARKQVDDAKDCPKGTVQTQVYESRSKILDTLHALVATLLNELIHSFAIHYRSIFPVEYLREPLFGEHHIRLDQANHHTQEQLSGTRHRYRDHSIDSEETQIIESAPNQLD